jgi:arabinofuranan 3-O-arabinosyltransferase
MIRPVRNVVDWSARRQDRAVAAFLAIAAYVPMLLTSPGRVSADTKSYLTLDPGAVLRQATTMWDPSVGAGTVPHQNIGYLFPLGPFYWLMDAVGIPDWLTQRLLWGTLVFAAAYGMYRLVRWLGWTPVAAVVAAFAYGFSPYLLSYLARLSVILGPWAAMPWMILLAAKAARTRSWRPAAQFAVVVGLVGSVNATALVLAGIGPIVWLVADVAAGRVRLAAAVRGSARIAVLSIAVSIWWIVALRIQGAFGLPILEYTETYQAVAGASTPTELIRGLGYWFFYGGDRLDTWVGPSLPYLDRAIVIGLGFVIGAIGLLGFLRSFIGRASAAGLLLVGMAVSAGAAPLDNSTPYGRLFEWFATESTAGLALRSTPRAAPLVVMALALGLASSSEWLRKRLRSRSTARWDLLAPVGAVALVGLQLFPWFTGNALTPSLLRDEHLPEYQTDLADWLEATGSDGRVYELPAADFAAYRWGGTVDPVLPGLIDRPYLARELVPQGSAATADLLNAFERRLPEGWFEPETLEPIARRFGAETVVVRNDLEHERYRVARPGHVWTDVTAALGEPDHAGPLVVDTPRVPVLDERTLARPEAADEFPVVAAFELGRAPAATTVSASSPIILAGSGDGVVDLAGARLLDPDRPLLYAATLDDLGRAGALDPAVFGTDPWWVFTDTNRKQGRRWSTVSSNLGGLEADGSLTLDDDPGDNRLELFQPGDQRLTRARHDADFADIRASYYGNRIAYTPEDAPWFATDGDPSTAWRAAVFEPTTGLVWEADLTAAVSSPTVTVLQPTTGATDRYITEIRIDLDDTVSFDVTLDERSRVAPGQPIELPDRPFESLRIEVLADNVGELSNYAAQPGVGLAEVTIAGLVDDRTVRVPGFDAFEFLPDNAASSQRLTYVLTRERLDPATANRTAPEPRMVRQFDVAEERSFVLVGEVRLAGDAPESTLLEALDDDVVVIADRRLRGSPAARGASAFDGDPTTAWQTPFDGSVGATVTVEGGPASVGTVTVSWFDDEQHSVPTQLTLSAADGSVRILDLPAREPVDGLASATIDIDPVDATTLTVTVSGIDARTSPEDFSGLPRVLPIGLAEVQLGDDVDVVERSADEALDASCRDDLVTLDGEPVAVRLVGTRGDAVTRSELRLESCAPISLAPGGHRLDAAAGAQTGFDIDRIVLDSAASSPTPATTPAPTVTIDESSSTSFELTVAPSDTPSWLILQQSWNAGWTAHADGEDLGEPVLINGYANGWLLPAAATSRQIVLDWAPQRTVTVALWFSLAAGIIVLALAAGLRRRPDDDPADVATGRRVPRWALAICLGAAVVVFAGPLVALVAAALAALSERWRWLPAVVVVACLGFVGVGISALEWRYDFPAAPDWPSRFSWAAPLVWIAIVTVVVAAFRPALLESGPPSGEPDVEPVEQ